MIPPSRPSNLRLNRAIMPPPPALTSPQSPTCTTVVHTPATSTPTTNLLTSYNIPALSGTVGIKWKPTPPPVSSLSKGGMISLGVTKAAEAGFFGCLAPLVLKFQIEHSSLETEGLLY